VVSYLVEELVVVLSLAHLSYFDCATMFRCSMMLFRLPVRTLVRHRCQRVSTCSTLSCLLSPLRSLRESHSREATRMCTECLGGPKERRFPASFPARRREPPRVRLRRIHRADSTLEQGAKARHSSLATVKNREARNKDPRWIRHNTRRIPPENAECGAWNATIGRCRDIHRQRPRTSLIHPGFRVIHESWGDVCEALEASERLRATASLKVPKNRMGCLGPGDH